MPIVGMKDCGGGPPRSGIPVRLAPQNICDVNPYVCRMTPASINFNAEKPFVGKLSFEPHPRGCQCCAKAAALERESFHHYHAPRSKSPQGLLGFDRHERLMSWRGESDTVRRSPTEETLDRGSRASPQLDRHASVLSQQVSADANVRKMKGKLSKEEKKKAQQEKKKVKHEKESGQKMAKLQKWRSSPPRGSKIPNFERIRLLREEKRRDDFVTACCTGLLLTPCVSAGSCSEEADEREQANFYIQCKCCPGTHDGNECQARKQKRGKHADFPCQCRNCKYQDKGCVNLKNGCMEQLTTESPVCYCTEEEKKEYRPSRICNDEPRQRGFLNSVIEGGKTVLNSLKKQGDATGTVCDGMLPTRAGLLTCSKDNGDACTKMVMTAELLQDMLIKQAQQGIELANSLLTNKKFQLVDVDVPESQRGQFNYRSQPIQTSRTEQKSEFIQTSRSHQPVELNDPSMKCYLQDVNLPDVTLSGPETGQIRLQEPLPRAPLNPYESELNTTGQHDNLNASLNVNLSGKNWSQPMPQPTLQPQYQQPNETMQPKYGYAYHGPNEAPMRVEITTPFLQPNINTQPYASYQAPVDNTPMHRKGPQNGITGHICIPRDALYQDPKGTKLCIPLSYDPRTQMDSANCPFEANHVQAQGVPETIIMARSDSQRVLQRGGSKPGLKQGLREVLQKEDSRQLESVITTHGSRPHKITHGSMQDAIPRLDSRQALAEAPYGSRQDAIPRLGSRQALAEAPYGSRQDAIPRLGSRQALKEIAHGSMQDAIPRLGSRQVITEVLRPELQREDSRQRLPKESCRMANIQQGPIPDNNVHATTSMQQVSSWDELEARKMKAKQPPERHRQVVKSWEQMEAEKTKAREPTERVERVVKSLEQMEARDAPERTRRKHSDRERRKIDSGRERRDRSPERRRRSDLSPERSYRRRHSNDPTREPKPRHRKRSASPCEEYDSTLRKGDPTRKRRPSPTEMVKTLNGYETDLVQAMDQVKDKYLKKRGNETSSSKGSSLDSAPGLAEFNCLLKHITCLRKELKKYSRDDAE